MAKDQHGLRTALIREAIGLLESGTTELSLRQVARAAGVSPMAPYRHFADKMALLRAVAEHGFDRLRIDLEAADDVANHREGLLAQGLAYVAFARSHPALFRLMFTDHCAPGTPVNPGAAAYAVLTHRVEAAFPDEPGAATLACWAIVHGLATLALDGRTSGEAGETRAVLDLFVTSLHRSQR